MQILFLLIHIIVLTLVILIENNASVGIHINNVGVLYKLSKNMLIYQFIFLFLLLPTTAQMQRSLEILETVIGNIMLSKMSGKQ